MFNFNIFKRLFKQEEPQEQPSKKQTKIVSKKQKSEKQCSNKGIPKIKQLKQNHNF